jgi:Tfp pilus assembly protein PilN
MPLNINLLAEEQQLAAARLSDPLKIVLRIAALVYLALLLAIGWLFFRIKQFEQQTGQIRQQWREVEKGSELFWAEKKTRDELHAKVMAYYQYATRRLLWGNLLETIRRLVPPEIYLTEISGTTDFIRTQLPPAEAQPAVEMDVETRLLIIRGRARGANYVDVLEAWLKTLRTAPSFSSLVARQTDVTLELIPVGDSRTSPQSREAEFVVRCQLKPMPLR